MGWTTGPGAARRRPGGLAPITPSTRLRIDGALSGRPWPAAASPTRRSQLGPGPGRWDTLARPVGREARRPRRSSSGRLQPPAWSRRWRQALREREIFPIRDQNGRAGAWAAGSSARRRSGRDTGPKYLNTPARRSSTRAARCTSSTRPRAMRKSGQAVIVEGYTDALMAHQAGFDNVVASLGTALTPGQVALLTRYAKRSRWPTTSTRPARRRHVRRPGAPVADRPARGDRRAASSSTRSGSSGCPRARTPTRSCARRPTAGARRSGPRSRSSSTVVDSYARRTTSRRRAARPASWTR